MSVTSRASASATAGRSGPCAPVRRGDDRVEAGGHAEPLAEHPRVDRPHAGGVGRQPPGREPPRARGVGCEGDRHADRDPRGGGRVAPATPPRRAARVPPAGASGPTGRAPTRRPARRPAGSRPATAPPARSAPAPPGGRRGAAGGRPAPGPAADRPPGAPGPPSACGAAARAGRSHAIPWNPSVSGGLPAPRPSEKRPPERPLQAGRGEGDGRRRAAPDGDDRRAEADVRGPLGQLREEERRVVRPRLGDLDAIEAQLVRPGPPGGG